MPEQPLHRFKAEFFRALGHPARLRILELLRGGERTVSALQAALEIEASSVSQQLALLRAKNIVATRRAGTSVYYSVRDPQIFQLLDVAREIFNNHLIDLQAMLDIQTRQDDQRDGRTSQLRPRQTVGAESRSGSTNNKRPPVQAARRGPGTGLNPPTRR